MVALGPASEGADQAIVVKPCHRLVGGSLNAFALTVWLGGGFSFAHEWPATNSTASTVFLYALLILWLAASALLILSLGWILFGAKVVSTRDGSLMIEYRVRSTTIGRPEAFAISYIQGMRSEERRHRYRGKTTIKHAITFYYLGHNRELIAQLSRQRAEALLNGPLRKFV
jgi:hypothetical protein